MSGRLAIDFTSIEGAVPRMLGLVERRGFDLSGISMIEREGQGRLVLDVRPRDASRQLDVVARQLRRLHEVQRVTLANQEPS